MDYRDEFLETHHGRIHVYAGYFKVKLYLCGKEERS